MVLCDMCSRQDMRICDNLIPRSIIIRKNHSNYPSQNCFLIFVNPVVISPKTLIFPVCLFRIQ
ncbi:hypothetical protein Hanom_Chr05g00468281 [Helianthus anomalus]